MIFEEYNKIPYIYNQKKLIGIPCNIEYLIVGHSFGGTIELATEWCKESSIFVKPEDIPEYESKLLDELKKCTAQGFVYFGEKKVILGKIHSVVFENGATVNLDQPFTINSPTKTYSFDEVCKVVANYSLIPMAVEIQKKNPEKSIIHCCIMAAGYKQLDDGKWAKA